MAKRARPVACAVLSFAAFALTGVAGQGGMCDPSYDCVFAGTPGKRAGYGAL